MRTRATRIAAAALAVALACGLGACEGQVPEPQAAASNVDVLPDLTEDQEQRMRSAILDAYNQSIADLSADGLSSVLTGPMLDVHTSRITVARSTGAMDPLATIPGEIEQTVIPTDSGWPRVVYSITTTTEDQQSMRLLVFTQDSPRQNYKLWGVVRLFPGTELPSFTIPSIGSSMGTAGDEGLVATPQEAVERYADVLQNGANSEYAGQFADDSLRQYLTTLSQTVQEGMERNNGTQQQTFTPVTDTIKVMRSSDGGDLVVAQINSDWTRAAGDGRQSLPASDAEQALFGDGTATSTMHVTYVNVVALYIPPADSGEQIVAVGAERQPISVEAL
ncbi:hypothetical protein [Bifidobacterium phasiani]|uniref:DUF8094 domain-containing protein n=1 Tax=Bifidobacterium phasiani TaxID=2834431 RepID=A0ABS6W9R1_9BIFI|nr:hypothetical protein [Bifidobacterium phasiani]MBW3083235.1 hypothetical protein [Bifidobacterium phasiani]